MFNSSSLASFKKWICVAAVAALASACSGGGASQSTLPATTPDSQIPVTPQVGATSAPAVPQAGATASPGVGTMDVISHSGTNWDVTGTLIAKYASNEWDVQGGAHMGYVHIYTTSTTAYGTGTLPLAVGEQVEIIGTSSTTANFPASITATKITKTWSSSTPTSAPAPSGSGVTPLAASTFNNSVGVGVHIAYSGSTYDKGWSSYAPALIDSGIKHVRDGLCGYGANSSWCTGTWAPRLKQLASAGIHFDMVWDARNCWSGSCGSTPTSAYASTLGITGVIDAWEGPNECDDGGANCPSSGYPGTSWQSNMQYWMKDLMTFNNGNVQIFGPAMAHTSGYTCCGNLSAYMDYGSIHDYPGASWPEEGYVPSWKSAAANMAGSKPIVSTESGYNTDPTFANQGVSQLTQERLEPRILFTHLYYGINRTYLYELIDEGASGSGYEYGLLNSNYSPKPVFTRLKQLLTYFSDSGTSPRAPLAYTLAGDTTGKLFKLLFQKSNGNYILVPWLGTQQWNPTTHTTIAPSNETLKLTLPASVTSVTVTKFGDNGAMTTTTLTPSNGSFALPVSSLIEAVQFHT